MKVVILVGGLGTRIAEEISTRSKQMVDIRGRPIPDGRPSGRRRSRHFLTAFVDAGGQHRLERAKAARSRNITAAGTE